MRRRRPLQFLAASTLAAGVLLTGCGGGGGDDAAFQQNYPYPGDELLDDLLTALGRGNQKERFLTLTNRIVSHAVGRINTKLVEREVDNFLAGGDSVDRELIATRDIIHTALTKAQQDDEEAKALMAAFKFPFKN